MKTDSESQPTVTHTNAGVVTENDVLKVFEQRFREEKHMHKHISMRATTTRMIRKGKTLFTPGRNN